VKIQNNEEETSRFIFPMYLAVRVSKLAQLLSKHALVAFSENQASEGLYKNEVRRSEGVL